MKLKKDTICVQGGWQPKNGEPRVLPIYQSTTFRYETSEEMGKLFDLEKEGYFYSRLQNPTCDIVAQKICDLEGGVAAMLTSSGQAATMLAVTNICEAGDHIICAAKIYGGTSNLLAVTLHRFGVEVDLVDQDLPEEELEKYFKPNTKAVFAETISNPAGVVLDIAKFVNLAHSHGVPVIIPLQHRSTASHFNLVWISSRIPRQNIWMDMPWHWVAVSWTVETLTGKLTKKNFRV